MNLKPRSLFLLVPLATALAGVASCTAPTKGSLVLAISTDMQTPKDISVVSVFITSDSVVKFDYLGRVLPDGTVALPATLAIVEPDNPGAQIRIRVTAFQEQKARVLRDVVTTVPHQHSSLLRLPLNLLDDGSVTGTLPASYVPLGPGGAPEGDTSYDPIGDPQAKIAARCDFTKNLTSVNGECVDSTVDSMALPEYTQAQVYGAGGLQANGAPVTCFDVASCFAGATPVAGVSMTRCSFPLPQGADPAKLNLALVTPDTGWCATPGQCFVPLENDPTSGWEVTGNTVQMVGGACVKMMAGAQLYQVEGPCAARAPSAPVCEPTTTMQLRDAGAPSDAAADAVVTRDGAVADASADAPPLDSGAPCPANQMLCGSTCVAAGKCGAVDAGAVPDAGPSDGTAGCANDTQCGGAAPHCNTATGACVQCMTTTDCQSGQTCSTSTFTCTAGADAGAGTDSGVSDASGG